MGFCDRKCVILQTNRARCALNKELLWGGGGHIYTYIPLTKILLTCAHISVCSLHTCCMRVAHIPTRPAYMQDMLNLTMCALCVQDTYKATMQCLCAVCMHAAYKSSKPYIYAAHTQYVSSRPSLYMCCICAVGKVQEHPAYVLLLRQ